MLTTSKLIELGNLISDEMSKFNINKTSLYITSNKEMFKKLDEDLFYRINDDKEKEYVPSENEINLSFPYLNIIIKKED